MMDLSDVAEFEELLEFRKWIKKIVVICKFVVVCKWKNNFDINRKQKRKLPI